MNVDVSSGAHTGHIWRGSPCKIGDLLLTARRAPSTVKDTAGGGCIRARGGAQREGGTAGQRTSHFHRPLLCCRRRGDSCFARRAGALSPRPRGIRRQPPAPEHAHARRVFTTADVVRQMTHRAPQRSQRDVQLRARIGSPQEALDLAGGVREQCQGIAGVLLRRPPSRELCCRYPLARATNHKYPHLPRATATTSHARPSQQSAYAPQNRNASICDRRHPIILTA